MKRISFTSDYMEGAHPLIMQRLMETNLEKTPGYGTDAYCEAAKAKIRSACHAPEGEIFFLVGGTQTNATVIDGLLQSYQGVIAAETGHIGVHEAGAIEFGGHKVLTRRTKMAKSPRSRLKSCFAIMQTTRIVIIWSCPVWRTCLSPLSMERCIRARS